MPKYRVIVAKIQPDEVPSDVNVEVYAQTFDDTEFDLNTLVLALNKKRRVRKARGKENNA